MQLDADSYLPFRWKRTEYCLKVEKLNHKKSAHYLLLLIEKTKEKALTVNDNPGILASFFFIIKLLVHSFNRHHLELKVSRLFFNRLFFIALSALAVEKRIHFHRSKCAPASLVSHAKWSSNISSFSILLFLSLSLFWTLDFSVACSPSHNER